MERIILFDGECNFCEWNVRFIIKRDPRATFKFAPLQSNLAQSFINGSNKKETYSTVVLIENHKIYTESTAALRISKQLNGIWPILYFFIIIPRPLRNLVYRYFAENRYKWFGKKEQCMVPTPELRKRFLH